MKSNWMTKHLLTIQRASACVMVAVVASLVVLLAQFVAAGSVANGAAQKAMGLTSLLVLIWAVAVFWMVLTGRLDSKLLKARLLFGKTELDVDNTK